MHYQLLVFYNSVLLLKLYKVSGLWFKSHIYIIKKRNLVVKPELIRTASYCNIPLSNKTMSSLYSWMKVALCFSSVGILCVSGLPAELDQIAVQARPLQAGSGTERPRARGHNAEMTMKTYKGFFLTRKHFDINFSNKVRNVLGVVPASCSETLR